MKKIKVYITYAIWLARGYLFKKRYARKISKVGKRFKVHGIVKVHGDRKAKMNFGNTVSLYDKVNLYLDSPKSNFSIGDKSFLNRGTDIVCKEKISIGDYCAISWDVTITDTDYHSIEGKHITSPVEIGNRVWIGFGATILKGVKIGNGSVVAAKSVVTKDVPPGCLVAGSPARVIKENISWKF